VHEYYVEIGTSNFRDDLYERLCDLRVKDGLPLDLYECNEGTSYIVRCVFTALKGKFEENRLTAKIYNYYFARALADTIFKRWEEIYIRKILKKDYNMSPREIENILEMSTQNLGNSKTYLREMKKNVLVKSILEFLDCHTRLNLEGFMNFRADHYKRELRKQISCIVNEYVCKQEHVFFVNSLKRFLRGQPNIFSTVHLIIKPQGEVLFLDDRGRNINRTIKDDYPLEIKADLELYEDFLITSVLKCAPQHLVVHCVTEDHADMIRIINDVFEEKVIYCKGCNLCSDGD